jgi:hypothetical protein
MPFSEERPPATQRLSSQFIPTPTPTPSTLPKTTAKMWLTRQVPTKKNPSILPKTAVTIAELPKTTA